MSEFFDKTFYGNTVAEWSIALLIIVGSFVLAKIIYWVFGNIVKRLTQKTKTKLDDIIIDMVEEPVVMAIVLGGFWYGVSYLNLSEGMDNFMSKVFYVALTFNVSWFVVRLLDALIVEYLTPFVEKTEGDLDDQLLPIIRKSVKAAIWIVAVVVGLNNAGYDVGALIAGLGIGGLALAMAAKDSVSNLFGGLTVFVDKPFTLGDRIKIDSYDGVIEEVGIRTTRLRTLAGRQVTIPNKVFTESFIENITSEPSRKMVLNLGLTYDTTAEQMEQAFAILKKINEENESTTEESVQMFSGYGDFSLNILYIYYIKSGESWWEVPNSMNLAILRQFNEAGLEFAFPTHTIIQQTEEQLKN